MTKVEGLAHSPSISSANRGYTISMSSNFHSVALEALNLDPSDRLRLATELTDSVESKSNIDWEEAWLTELNNRRELGLADAIPWSEAKATIIQRLLKR